MRHYRITLSIQCQGDAVHRQTMSIVGQFTDREHAAAYGRHQAQIMDGTHPAYLEGTFANAEFNKCGMCGHPFEVDVLRVEPYVEPHPVKAPAAN